MTPLMLAARKGYAAVIVQLLNALVADPERMYNTIVSREDPDPDSDEADTNLNTDIGTDSDDADIDLNTGRTALHLAAQRGHGAVVLLLNALVTHLKLIHSLIMAKDNDGWTALHYAASNGHETVVSLLLNALATQPDYTHSRITTKDDGGWTALHWAAFNGHEAVVAQLLNALVTHPELIHSLITAKNNDGRTALHWAALSGREVVVAQLLNALATHPERMHSLIAIQDNDDLTALHWTARYGHDAVVVQLLDALAIHPERVYSLITTHDRFYRTVIRHACINSKISTIKVLLEHYKEALDKISSDTLLYTARISSTCTDFANLADPEGKALALSVTHDSVEIIDLLAQLGANLNVRDENGDTHLHRAARDGRSAVVIALVNNGAESQRNNAGRTPYDVAQDLTPEALGLL